MADDEDFGALLAAREQDRRRERRRAVGDAHGIAVEGVVTGENG